MERKVCKNLDCGATGEQVDQTGYCSEACRKKVSDMIDYDLANLEALIAADEEYYRHEEITVLVPVKMKVHKPTDTIMFSSIKIPTSDEIRELYQKDLLKEVRN